MMHSLMRNDLSVPSHAESFILAFLITLYVTGVFALIGFAYPSNKLLPTAYYRIHNPSLLKAICRLLGVRYFKTILLFAFWGSKKNRKKYFNGTKAGLVNFIYQTKQSEFGHLGAFVIILGLSIALLWRSYQTLVLCMMLINIIGNLYPILLQRSHRIRVDAITEKI